MRRFKHYLFTLLGLAVLVGALTILGPKYGQSAPPVPGPLDVNVVNTPLSVTGTITGTPNVNVSNTESSPVPVKDVDTVTRQIYQDADYVTFTLSPSVNVTFGKVPIGYILVIEHASILIRLTDENGIASNCQLTTKAGGVIAAHHFPSVPVGSRGSQGPFFVCSQQMRIYADANSEPVLNVGRENGTTSDDVFASISGYLIPNSSPSLSP